MLVEIKGKDDFDEYKGKLNGKIIMNGKVKGTNPKFKANAKRVSDERIEELEGWINPGRRDKYRKGSGDWRKKKRALHRFFKDEGVAAIIEPSKHFHHLVVVQGSHPDCHPDSTVPAFVISREQYGRISRILDKDYPVKLALSSDVEFSEDSIGYNVVAEIPGTDRKLKDEVVLIGAHLDSWHSGTGASDNGANCAIMMEVLRIFKELDIKPRRTIRMGLWGGEEQGYLGSKGYVKKHLGNYETMELLPDHEKFAGYFNLDNGSGRIRGIQLQGNEYCRPIFKKILDHFDYWDANTISTKNTSGTDHIPFNWIGLPAFQFIQDPIEYFPITWHTNLDVYESLLEDDMKQATAIIATMVYHVAMRDEMLPREDLPEIKKDNEDKKKEDKK